MPSEKIERTIRGGQADDLFKQVEATLDLFTDRYSLQKKVDAEHGHISLKKRGLGAEVQIQGDKIICQLSYSPLMPGPIRQRITTAVGRALEQMAPPGDRRTTMATEKIERTLPGRQADDLFKAVAKTIDPYVKKYSLKEQVDAAHRHISVKRTGMSGELQVEGDKVSCQLNYSPLIPGPIRNQITKGVASALDHIGGTA